MMKKLLPGICLCALVCCSCGSSKESITSGKSSADNTERIAAPNSLQQEKVPPGTERADQLRPTR